MSPELQARAPDDPLPDADLRAVRPAAPTPARSRAASLVDRVHEVFAPAGGLARAFDAFEPRPGQQQLARRVAETFERGGTLVAEAGTGTGKTLAYLVPAVLAGRRVLISTGTRTLQDQIFYKDLPALARAMGVDIRAAYMKGRTNYLCLHRFERLREAEAGLAVEDRDWLARIGDWSQETATGDRAELEDLPDDFPLWSEVTATSEQCLGRECPRYADCFVTRMRERANDASVLIVNHHLLCADASVRQGAFGEVIPPCDFAVIDEAHQLEDVVTQYFGISISTYRLDEFVRDAGRASRLLEGVDDKTAAALADVVDRIEFTGRALFDLARLEVRQSGGGDRLILSADIAHHLSESGLRFQEALDRFGALARRAPDAPEDLKAVATRSSTISTDVQVLLDVGEGQFVHFVEMRGRGVFLRAAPIEVAQIVREAVIGNRAATVLTSATLRVDAGFDYMIGRLGLTQASTIALPSEFDFRRQAVLYLPSDMPDPRSSEFNRAAAWAIADLLDKTRGRAFVLFTSYAAMRAVHDLLRARLPWPMLIQGAAPRTALLRDFRATPNAVLLATSSFWQGVDVAGDALSCVIIDRLPFASPTDPLIAARIAAVNRAGGNAFADYQVPLATLTLLQGLGRLIRTRTDRGVLAILDPRLTGKSYGRRFLASLPPAPITSELSEIDRFFSGADVN